MKLELEIRNLISEYGTKRVLEALVDAYVECEQDYLVNLRNDLQKALDMYEYRYDPITNENCRYLDT